MVKSNLSRCCVVIDEATRFINRGGGGSSVRYAHNGEFHAIAIGEWKVSVVVVARKNQCRNVCVALYVDLPIDIPIFFGYYICIIGLVFLRAAYF